MHRLQTFDFDAHLCLISGADGYDETVGTSCLLVLRHPGHFKSVAEWDDHLLPVLLNLFGVFATDLHCILRNSRQENVVIQSVSLDDLAVRLALH